MTATAAVPFVMSQAYPTPSKSNAGSRTKARARVPRVLALGQPRIDSLRLPETIVTRGCLIRLSKRVLRNGDISNW